MDTKTTEDVETEEVPSTTNDLDALRSKVKGLNQELAATNDKLTAAQTELEKSETLRTEAERCTVELRKKVETLSGELDDLRKTRNKSVAEVACQVDMVAKVASSKGGATAGSAGPSDWVTEVGTSNPSTSQSIADSVRAVAEATATRTGFVLDQTSGMYYDCNSGYYYDQVNKLYYDPNNGMYYYFDEVTGSYQFHSQVDLPPSARPGQVHHGRGRGRAWGKRKDRRHGEAPENVDERRRDTLEDMDCQIIEIGQDTRHEHKRRRRDISRDRLRSSSERDGDVVPGRAHRERRRRRERRIHSYEGIGAQVEVVTNEHAQQLEERMRSRERRRKRRQESGSKRRKEKSLDGNRKDENYDRRNVQGQEDGEPMDGMSDGEIRADEGTQLDGLEGGGSQSQKNHKTGNDNRNQSAENEADENNQDEGNEGRNAAGTSEKPKDKTSPETIRGSSESSTAKDDSPSGEEGKNDESKGDGQRSPDEVGRHRRVIVPNPDAEARQGQTDEQPNPGDLQEGYSDGEIVEDVMIVEDGQELIVLSSDEMEEGELSDSLSDISSSEGSSLESPSASSEDYLEEISVDSDSSGGLEVLKVDYPPCIRMIVTKSDTLKPGSLFIITCEGGTIGREGSSHVILIQSVKVSKRHAHIVYNAEERRYTIVDLGSQNGTLLNGKAISEQRVVSEPHPLSHRDYITIGGTTLRLHIHPGDETCEECEPGQVQALIAMQQLNQLSAGATSGSKHDKEQQRRKELRHLKKKFNLAKEDYTNQQDPSLTNPGYADRAGERRRTMGSDNPYQPDDQPASVDKAIGSTNLGHKLLSKMGWAEGQSLGKGDRGIKEPIQAVVHSRSAGLGAGTVQTMDQVQYARRRKDKWDKARGRFNLIDPQHPGAANLGKKGPRWVQGDTEKLDANGRQCGKSEDQSGAGVFGVVQLPLAGRGKGNGRAGTSQGITDIWDESMDASNSKHLGKSGQTSSQGSSKDTGETVESRGRTAAKDARKKQHDTPEEFERLLLGEKADDKTSEGTTEPSDALPRAEGGSNDVHSGSGSKSGRGRTRHSSTPASNVDGGNNTGQTAKADSSSVDDMESTAKPFSDANSPLTTTVDSTEQTSAVASEHPALPETNADEEQSAKRPENLNRPDGSTSPPPSQTPDRNQEAAANKMEKEKGGSPKLADQLNLEGADPGKPAEAAGSSSDKGKTIQLKWNKGGKEKLATNLVAFEESESEGEGGESAANDSKSIQQEQARPPQRKGDRGTRRRRGSGRPSRWSGSRNSSGK
ncbi:uncharacterized protein LOC119746525 isoform X2 [Patiria miniata]|uniref:Angiogenic factor with G patch and FHA domains 1 n=1 Tax=Patiria miniata TaxID=46514 RepID=A0A914BU46_PATMI|nr:uncharacterized protein LOC119746525 isoform X2 [Patiria miniata]